MARESEAVERVDPSGRAGADEDGFEEVDFTPGRVRECFGPWIDRLRLPAA